MSLCAFEVVLLRVLDFRIYFLVYKIWSLCFCFHVSLIYRSLLQDIRFPIFMQFFPMSNVRKIRPKQLFRFCKLKKCITVARWIFLYSKEMLLYEKFIFIINFFSAVLFEVYCLIYNSFCIFLLKCLVKRNFSV